MSGKIIYEPHRPTACKRGMCEGKPKPESYSDGTIWQCDECGSQWEKWSGAQYNEPFDSWRQKGGEYESAPEFADWREAMHGFRRWLTDYTPTTDEMRSMILEFGELIAVSRHEPEYRDRLITEFDRWLAEHDRVVKSKAWAEGFAEGQWVSNPYREETK